MPPKFWLPLEGITKAYLRIARLVRLKATSNKVAVRNDADSDYADLDAAIIKALTRLIVNDAGATDPTSDILLGLLSEVNRTIQHSFAQSSDANSAIYRMRKSRGTLGSPSAVNNGENLGVWQVQGYDGSTFANAIQILARPVENWSGTARGSEIFIQVNTPTTTTAITVMRLRGNGQVEIRVLRLVPQTTPTNPSGSDKIVYINSSSGYATIGNASGVISNVAAPDYDSGWFAVAANTTYTKAHGLSITPRHVEVWWSSTNTPTGSTLLYPVCLNAADNTNNASCRADGTNVELKTGATNTLNNIQSGAQTGGYYRIYAWKDDQ